MSDDPTQPEQQQQQQQRPPPPPPQPPQHQQIQMAPPQGRAVGSQKQIRGGGAGRGLGGQQHAGGRGSDSRGYNHQQGGRGQHLGGGRGRGGGISLNPNSGIPYGHVPSYLPGSASLVEQLDQRVLVILRDGKHIVGFLSSFDQFSNMILQEALERRCYTSKKDQITYYSDVPLGVYIIRGDSMVLLGNISDNKTMFPMKEVSLDELEEKEREDKRKVDEASLAWDFDTDLIA